MLFAYGINRFSHDVAQTEQHKLKANRSALFLADGHKEKLLNRLWFRHRLHVHLKGEKCKLFPQIGLLRAIQIIKR